MGSKLLFEQVIKNEYLGETKVIRGRDPTDLRARVETQLNKWSEKERKQREKDKAKADRAAAENQAAQATEEAQADITALNKLLLSGLEGDHRIDWESLKDCRQFPSFSFDDPRPTPPEDLDLPRLADYHGAMFVPRRSVFEAVLPWLRHRREKAEKRARVAWQKGIQHAKDGHKLQTEQYESAEASWLKRRENAEKQHDDERVRFRRHQRAQHDEIDRQREAFTVGEPDDLCRCLERALMASELPAGLDRDLEVDFDPHSETVVVSHMLPTLDDLPSAVEYRYVVSRKEIQRKEMKEKDRAELFGAVVDQLALRTIHEVFEVCSDCEAVMSVVFNGWADGIDPKTGNAFHSCVLSCQVSREEYDELSLSHVDPHECLRSLSALSAGPLHELAPVRPILELDRDDDRFIESRDVLEAVEAGAQNLATMDWQDFEHLVRELFARIYSGDGCEVHVTQASRDVGVDAIAFDPDPVNGGKIVIQAKRYNNIVGFGAVRELYGTVVHEGATKGILVTTSHYGHDARDFAKGKPITLIDGANLAHLLQEHGYENVYIETKSK